MKTTTIEPGDFKPVGMSDETARDVWSQLCRRIEMTGWAGDPLSPSELKLYETLTILLTARAQLVGVSVTEAPAAA